MKKHSTSQRFLSALLTVALLLGCLAGFPTTADASVVGELPLTKVADPATVNMWKEYFSADSTANAGGIWTDKSVFVSAEDYINATAEKEDAAAVENLALLDGNDFLVSLSAMASAKSIDGYACIPTDTILILDTSASMQSSGSDDDLVNAANQAIDTLLNLNKHNRIGVVLYSKDAVTILPLDRYQAGDTYKADKVTYQEYLKFITDGSTHSIKVGDKLKNSAGKTVTGTSRPYGWGTFIQSGLDNAMDMFLDAEPQITGDVFQAGTVRLPVTILMSDGAPTYGTTKYNNADTVSMGDSWDATNTLGFVTQLTAAHTKAKVEAHYGRSSLFYTLGLGMDKIEQVGSDDDQAIAKSVMDPSNNTSKIKKYWKDFLADGTVDCTQAGATVTVTHAKKDTVTLEQYATYKNYVTKSFSAKNAAGLNKAFTSIVEAITIQSMYYPTNLEGKDFDKGGYVEFRDYIGEGMEVKDVKGVQWGEVLHTGEDFAYTVKYGMGTEDKPTEAGEELLAAVMDRIGITKAADARELIQSAWNAGQLAYNDKDPDQITYSNYIGWYADKNGKYLGFWNHKAASPNVPSGAVQIVKSYFVLGDVQNGHQATDMLYASIQVRTTIATGEQIVYGRLPASLIPVMQYLVDVNSADPTKVTKATMDVTTATPSRLIYEVGLSDDVNLYALEPGNYEYYTNRWEDEIAEGDDPSTSHNSFASFQPSEENERYICHENVPVYIKDGSKYVRYTGSDAPAGGTYYRANTLYTATGDGDETQITIQYDQIPDQVLKKDSLKKTDTGWVIKKGTVYCYTPRACVDKSENVTNTLQHSEHPIVHMSPAYHLDAVLGNNGKLSFEVVPPKKVLDLQGNDIDGAAVMIGDVLTYEIAVTNYGQSDATLTITDPIPAGTAYLGGSATEGGTYDAAQNAVQWSIDNVAAGARVTVSFQVTVTEAAVDNIDNTATVQVGDAPAYETNTTTNTPIGKTSVIENGASADQLQVGSILEYTIRYRNETDQPADITVSDTIPAGTTYVPDSASHSGTDVLTETYDADAVTGLTWVIPQVPGGTAGSVTFRVRVNISAPEIIENTAAVQIGENAPTLTTNRVTDPMTYGDLLLTKTVVDGNAAGNREQYFTLEITACAEDGGVLNGIYAVEGSGKVEQVTFANGKAQLQIKHGEVITVKSLPAGINVSVCELVPGGYTDDYSAKIGKIMADSTVRMDVTNTYNVTSVSVVLNANKSLTGRELNAGEFQFVLTDENGREFKAANAADGTVSFGSFEYTQAGTYVYTLTETKGNLGGVTYDETAYTVKVVVTDNLEGQLVAAVYVDDQAAAADEDGYDLATFSNGYASAPVDLILKAEKVLSGRVLAEGEFSFRLTDAVADTTVTTNAADGSVTFGLSYAQPGIYEYTLSEVPGNGEYVIYDNSIYTVTVTIIDDGEGSLRIAAVTVNETQAPVSDGVCETGATFTNLYQEPELPELPDAPVLPETGDGSSLILNSVLLLGSLTALAALLLGKRRAWMA